MKKNSKTQAKQKVASNKSVNASHQTRQTVDNCLSSTDENQCAGGMCAVNWKPKRSAA